MNRSLGDLVDRLTITNLKLWFCQEQVFQCAKENKDLPAETNRRLSDLNLERNRLMTAIDETLDRAAREGHADVEPRIKIY